MRFQYIFLLLCGVLVVAGIGGRGAESGKYQNRYAEKVYEPVPQAFSPILSRVKNWNKAAEAELDKIARSTHPKVLAWRTAIMAVDGRNEYEFLREINAITNRAVVYVDDYKHYKKDFWAPPYETLTEGGDCEDIALLKAVALHLRGWSVSARAHILVGNVMWRGHETPHAVLQVESADKKSEYVMRSLNNNVRKMGDVVNEQKIKPLYMVNSKQLIVFREAGGHLAYGLPADAFQMDTAAGGGPLPPAPAAQYNR